MPAVSIIIPFYNAEGYLSDCLESVIRQTFTDWEAILVNDGSYDRSEAIALSYVGKEPRFHLVSEENKGLSAARNLGMANSVGEFIAFLDADDWWEKDFLEQHLNVIEGYDMVRSGYRRMYDGAEIGRKTPLHRWQFTTAWSGIFRHSSIADMRFEEGMYYEDVLWTVTFLSAGAKMKIIPYTGYNYRQHDNAITSTIHREDLKKLHRKLFRFWPRPVAIYTTIKMWLYTTVIPAFRN